MATKRQVTLARALSKLGVLSRTQARAAIAAGRVTVAGRVERDPDRWLDPDRIAIELDGVRAVRSAPVWWMVHKPAGVVTTRDDERGRPTVYALLPPDTPWVGPVGRLDQDSTGLLLLTNDTQLAERITGPTAKLAKVYEVDVDAPLQATDLERFRAGMSLDDERLLPVEVALPNAADPRRLVLTLREGKNRQIRRMLAACGREVQRLHRVAIGPLRLGELPIGGARQLTVAEVQRIAAAVGSRRRDGRGSTA